MGCLFSCLGCKPPSCNVSAVCHPPTPLVVPISNEPPPSQNVVDPPPGALPHSNHLTHDAINYMSVHSETRPRSNPNPPASHLLNLPTEPARAQTPVQDISQTNQPHQPPISKLPFPSVDANLSSSLPLPFDKFNSSRKLMGSRSVDNLRSISNTGSEYRPSHPYSVRNRAQSNPDMPYQTQRESPASSACSGRVVKVHQGTGQLRISITPQNSLGLVP